MLPRKELKPHAGERNTRNEQWLWGRNWGKGTKPCGHEASGSMLTHFDTASKPISSHSSPAVASTKGLFQGKKIWCVEEKACVKGKPQGLKEVVLSQPCCHLGQWSPTEGYQPENWRYERLATADLGTQTPHGGQWAQGEWNRTGVFWRQLLPVQFCYHFCTNSHVYIATYNAFPFVPITLSHSG